MGVVHQKSAKKEDDQVQLESDYDENEFEEVVRKSRPDSGVKADLASSPAK